MPAGIPLGFQSSNYTLISTNGTTTLALAQATGQTTPPSVATIYYGCNLILAGTAAVFTVLDIYTAGPTTTTNTIDQHQGTAGANFNGGAGAVGVRCKGNLVIVTTGTGAGTWMALWD